VIAKNEGEFDKMLRYSDIIQECQDDLKLVFLVKYANQYSFHSIHDAQYQDNMANKNNDYYYMQEQVAEEYDSQYEQERSLMHIVKIHR
jgi:hypothetical protein